MFCFLSSCTVNSWFKKDLNLQIHKTFFSDDQFLESVHKSFLNQTTLDLKWDFLNRELTVPLIILENLYWTNLIISSKLAGIRCRANSNFNHFLKFTPERTQSNAWLWEHQHKILNKLSRRLEHIIGLQVSNVEDIILASEAYQVKVALSWKVFFSFGSYP